MKNTKWELEFLNKNLPLGSKFALKKIEVEASSNIVELRNEMFENMCNALKTQNNDEITDKQIAALEGRANAAAGGIIRRRLLHTIFQYELRATGMTSLSLQAIELDIFGKKSGLKYFDTYFTNLIGTNKVGKNTRSHILEQFQEIKAQNKPLFQKYKKIYEDLYSRVKDSL
jgi:hypothetical protein